MSELKQQWNDLSALGFAEIDHEPLQASGKPYKIYAQLLDATAQQQFADVLNYPPVTYAALMPDAHGGYTMPIGGVCATTDVIVPQFVGFDIGCGMCAYKTEYHKDEVQGVVSSNPTVPTNKIKGLQFNRCKPFFFNA